MARSATSSMTTATTFYSHTEYGRKPDWPPWWQKRTCVRSACVRSTYCCERLAGRAEPAGDPRGLEYVVRAYKLSSSRWASSPSSASPHRQWCQVCHVCQLGQIRTFVHTHRGNVRCVEEELARCERSATYASGVGYVRTHVARMPVVSGKYARTSRTHVADVVTRAHVPTYVYVRTYV